MSDERIELEVTLDDRASDKLGDIADDVATLEKADPEIQVTADTTAAEGDVKALGTAADQLAKDDRTIVLKAQIDAAKADLKILDQQLKDLDDTSTRTGAKIGTDIEEGSGKAKSAVHSFTGEAITELPGIGDAVGPAGEAIGQMTEGLLAGEIAMGELVAAAVPLVAMVAAFKLISGYFADIEATKAFHRDQVDKWVKSLQAGETTLQGINDELKKTGEIQFIDDGDIKDASDAMVRLGIDVQDFTTAVGDSTRLDQWKKERDAVQDVIDKLRGKAQVGGMTAEEAATWDEAGKKLADYNTVIDATVQKKKDHADADKKLRDSLELTGPDLDKVAAATSRVGEAARLGKKPVDDFGDALDDTKDATDDVVSALDDLRGRLDLRSASDNAQTAIDDLATTVRDHGDDWEAVDDQIRDTQTSLLDYAQNLKDKGLLPARVETEVAAEIDDGSYNTAKSRLDQLAGERTVNYTIKAHDDKGRPLSGGLVVGGATSFVPATNVSINMPAGARGVDVVRTLTQQTRRTGRRYGQATVGRARR